MGVASFTEKVIAGVAVTLIVAMFSVIAKLYSLRDGIDVALFLVSLFAVVVAVLVWRNARFVVRGGGETQQTFVWTGSVLNGVPYIVIKNQHGQGTIRIETMPLGQVVLRFINPKTGEVPFSMIVRTADYLFDFRDHTGAAMLQYPS
jgi:hypothetical protein